MCLRKMAVQDPEGPVELGERELRLGGAAFRLEKKNRFSQATNSVFSTSLAVHSAH